MSVLFELNNNLKSEYLAIFCDNKLRALKSLERVIVWKK